MITVRKIRNEKIIITKNSIVYFWWFKLSCFSDLLYLLNSEIDFNKIKIKEIGNEKYGLLYIGKGKNGHDRLVKYHILDSQNFHRIGVENGRLSSLRQTLCGLLKYPMSTSRELIDEFININCIVEFEVCEIQELDNIEHIKIRENYLPLNYQNTKGVLSKRHRQILKLCKKEMRKQ